MAAPAKQSKNKNLFKRDTPLYITVILVIISGFIVYSAFPHPDEGKKITAQPLTNTCIPEVNILRTKDFQLTHRILLAETKNENPRLASIKEVVNRSISEEKSSNAVKDISVYYRSLTDGAWFEINGGGRYSPASLLKVAYLIAMLKQAEINPAILNKQVYFEKPFEKNYNQNIKSFSLEPKKYYSIRELLYDMIAYSDNNSLILVSMNTNLAIYQKLFSDLGMTPPPTDTEGSIDYSMSVTDYCKFFRILYNSAYLPEPYSEFALELLTKSTYKDGLLKNITGSFPVAHKFGERVLNDVHELHEVGIFYIDNKPYILGVMSTGSDLQTLSTVLGQISKVVYDESYKLN